MESNSEYEDEDVTFVNHDLCQIEPESSKVNLPHIERLDEDALFSSDPPSPSPYMHATGRFIPCCFPLSRSLKNHLSFPFSVGNNQETWFLSLRIGNREGPSTCK